MRSVWREGNWEVGRPVVSERRLQVLVTGHQREGEQSRGSLNIAGPLGGSRRQRQLAGVGVRVGVGQSETTDWWWEGQGQGARLWLPRSRPRHPLRVRY